jgi:hypothetical protein
MSRIATEADFIAQYDAEGRKIAGTGQVYEPQYERFTHIGGENISIFAPRVQRFVESYNPQPSQRFLVVGACYGFLVDEMRDRGLTVSGVEWNAWGAEASTFAISQAQSHLAPARANKIVLANAAVVNGLNAAKTAAGVANNQRFDVVITEDLLPCAVSEAEIQAMLTECRRVSANNGVLHLISCLRPGEVVDPNVRFSGYIWKTLAQWRTTLARPQAQEPILDLEGGVLG